jgi:hypothetical protein
MQLVVDLAPMELWNSLRTGIFALLTRTIDSEEHVDDDYAMHGLLGTSVTHYLMRRKTAVSQKNFFRNPSSTLIIAQSRTSSTRCSHGCAIRDGN